MNTSLLPNPTVSPTQETEPVPFSGSSWPDIYRLLGEDFVFPMSPSLFKQMGDKRAKEDRLAMIPVMAGLSPHRIIKAIHRRRVPIDSNLPMFDVGSDCFGSNHRIWQVPAPYIDYVPKDIFKDLRRAATPFVDAIATLLFYLHQIVKEGQCLMNRCIHCVQSFNPHQHFDILLHGSDDRLHGSDDHRRVHIFVGA